MRPPGSIGKATGSHQSRLHGDKFRGGLLGPVRGEASLDVVVHRELVRMRPHTQGVDLVLPLVPNPLPNHVLGEDVAAEQVLVVGFQGVDRLLQRAGRLGDLGEFLGPEVVDVLVERFARIVEDDLPDFTIPYCRKVTIVWCVFLAANALCVLVLALAAPIEWWALYSGLISYLLVGAIFIGEFVVHKIWFRYFGNGLIDRVFSRVFPPRRTANGRRSLVYQDRRERGETTWSSA